MATIQASRAGVSDVRWSPDSTRLATASGYINLGGYNDLTVNIWDVDTYTKVTTLTDSTQSVRSLDWSPDGKFLIGGNLEGTLLIWSTDR